MVPTPPGRPRVKYWKFKHNYATMKKYKTNYRTKHVSPNYVENKKEIKKLKNVNFILKNMADNDNDNHSV